MLMLINIFDDLNHIPCYSGASANKGAANEYREKYLCPSHGISSALRIPSVRRTISGQLQGKKFFLSGPVPVHGIRATDLSRESARHRVLFAIDVRAFVSYGHPRPGIAQYAGERKQPARLADVRRLRDDSYPQSARTVCQRIIRYRVGQYGIRLGCDHYRSVSVAFSLGSFSKEQGRDQAAHASRSARQYPVVHRDYRRESRGCKYPRRADPRTRIILHHGPRLSRLRTTISAPSTPGVLCDQNQVKYEMPPVIFTPCRQNNRHTVRSDYRYDHTENGTDIPGKTSPDRVRRFRDRRPIHFFDQQFYASGVDHRAALQIALESRAIFQMDQAAFAHQSVFRHIDERRQDASMDRGFDICAYRYHQKAS